MFLSNILNPQSKRYLLTKQILISHQLQYFTFLNFFNVLNINYTIIKYNITNK